MPRAYWNGFLKLAFVSCPVALYPATTAAERVSFRKVNRRTGHRLKRQLVDSVASEAVDTHDKARGYEVGEDRFLLVEGRELEQARSRHGRFLPILMGRLNVRGFIVIYFAARWLRVKVAEW